MGRTLSGSIFGCPKWPIPKPLRRAAAHQEAHPEAHPAAVHPAAVHRERARVALLPPERLAREAADVVPEVADVAPEAEDVVKELAAAADAVPAAAEPPLHALAEQAVVAADDEPTLKSKKQILPPSSPFHNSSFILHNFVQPSPFHNSAFILHNFVP